MSNVSNILEAANVRRALIVDDAYDRVPLASDLSLDSENWVRFFEDLNDDDKSVLKGLFPRYDQLRADQLQNDDAFIDALWSKRLTLRRDIIDPLFLRYSRDKDQDLVYLDTLKNRLIECGLQCDTAGRRFRDKAAAVDLIVIDLYLASAQDDRALETSIEGLKNVIGSRLANPPLVILMSRSGRLEDKREYFRDRSGLFESAFRIIRKAELSEEGKLARLLARLGEHYRDSLKLATFLNAWKTGLNNACDRTADLIRTLDLADYAQIQQLLLTDEGEAPGSYVVDIFDLVLQHEIERESAIIEAAINLLSPA